jgi:hypothetical protein
MRGTLQNLLLLAGSLLVTLLILELGVRVVDRPRGKAAVNTPTTGSAVASDAAARADSTSADSTRADRGGGGAAHPRYVPSDRLGWHLAPDTVQVFRSPGLFDTCVRSNQLGFRERPIEPRPPGVVRLVVLGDSYGFGWGVEGEETYAALLEQRLNAEAAGDRRYEVLNAALPGFGTFQRLRALEMLLDYGIDGVIVEFSVSNDIVDDWRAHPYVPDELGRYQSEGTRFPAFELFLARHSKLVQLVRRRTMPLRLWFECRKSGNMERTRGLWETLIARCREAGIEPVVLLNPSRYQLLTGDGGFMGAMARTDFSHRPNRLIREVAREHDLVLIDGETLFQVDDPARLFLGRDPHWTPAGHQLVADALIARLGELSGERARDRAEMPARP